MSDEAWDFLVERSDFHKGVFEASTAPEDFERDGGVLLKVDTFALTANNITYGVAGDMLYWQFFPAREGMGRIPVWGFGDVLASTVPEIAVGERVYGYFPMSTHLLIQPGEITPRGFVDASAHRAALPPVYNQFTRVAADPTYDASAEAAQASFRPLFTTSFLIDGFLADNDFFGAKTVVLTSASSKTSYGLAHLLHRNRRDTCRVVGVTGAANRPFVESLGCYDQVIGYDSVSSLAKGPAVVVDMAGNAKALADLHHQYGDDLKHSCTVGMTHWDALGEGLGAKVDLPGPEPTMFFAPDHVQRLIETLGPDGFQARLESAWSGFMKEIGSGVQVTDVHGHEGVQQAFTEVLDGNVRGSTTFMLSLWPE